MERTTSIVPRENLDFGLDNTIPRYWFRNDAFKTRLLDGIQVVFPDGERYFISSARAVRDRIKDPVLIRQVKDFSRQEGQHGMVHTKYNTLLAEQGMPMKVLLAETKERIDGYTRRFSTDFNVALTAAFEHFTALLAETFFARREVTEGGDSRVKAMFAWHAIEEMEHKSVVFDVMQAVTTIGYWRRCMAMVYATWQMTRAMFSFADQMLKADGFGWFQRKALMIRNLPWMYGRKGVFTGMIPKIIKYLLPGFHPSKIPDIHNYPHWVAEYDRSGCPHRACAALLAAAV